MKIEDLENIYNESKKVCPPDEFALRQRVLLWEVVRYIIEKDNPKSPEEEKNNE
jgi:hypothetical protein